MAGDRPRLEIWCEDQNQERFARELLTRYFKLDRKRLRFTVAPRGTGAASQWVIARYPDVVAKAHSTRHQARLGFLVIVDGDNVGLRPRFRALTGSPDGRPSNRPLAVWVPTWSIETWLPWLSGRTVSGDAIDESRSYKHEASRLGVSELIDDAVNAWEPPRDGESEQVPSLAAAREEMNRLPLS